MTQPDPKTEAPSDESKPAQASGFAALGIAPELLTALAALGYEEPTPIQREAIPPLLDRVASRGFALASLSTRQASLEDVFVSLTGRHLRDE